MNLDNTFNESLAQLAARPEFKALLKLLEINEKNILVQAFKVNSTDPQLREKKANYEGQIYMLRAIKNVFDKAVKSQEKEDNE